MSAGSNSTPAVGDARLAQEALWDELEHLSQPDGAQLDALLGRLLELPHDLTNWGDVLRELERRGHPDILSVYRRITGEVQASAATELAFFHWAAAELFSRPERHACLPEVARSFAALDGATYDADALAHIEDHLLAGRFDAETLALAERYLPITRAGVEEGSLTPYVVPFRCALVFQLRVGLLLRAPPAGIGRGQLAGQLRRDIEDEIDLEAAERAAGVISSPGPRTFAWADFQLPLEDVSDSDAAWQASLTLHDTLMGVAREAWHRDQISPGYGFRALCRLLESVHDARDDEPQQGMRDNLLSYLTAAGLEERIAQSCADILGTNESQAGVMLDAYGMLLRCAQMHALLPAAQIKSTRDELTRLAAVVVDI